MKKTVKKKQPRSIKKRTSKENRGISKVIVLVVVAVILAGAGGFYLLNQFSGAGVKLPLVKAPLNSKCEQNDPELCKFLNNWENQTNYSVTSTSTYGGMSMDSLYEIDGTDKFHMVSKQNGKESSNMISIGDTTYTLDYTDNKWWMQTVKPAEDTDTAATDEIKESVTLSDDTATDTTTYKFIAKEQCENLSCFKYEIVSAETTDSKQYIWFDDKDYVLRKMRMEDVENGSSESIYRYDTVSISAPSPVKEGTPTYGDSSMPSSEEVDAMMKQYESQMPVVEETDTTDYSSDEY